jgi:hypothetical protein
MAADNHTSIVGNLVEDPELRFTSSGPTLQFASGWLAGRIRMRWVGWGWSSCWLPVMACDAAPPAPPLFLDR